MRLDIFLVLRLQGHYGFPNETNQRRASVSAVAVIVALQRIEKGKHFSGRLIKTSEVWMRRPNNPRRWPTRSCSVCVCVRTYAHLYYLYVVV